MALHIHWGMISAA